MADNFADLARKLGNVDLARAQRVGAVKAAQLAKRITVDELRRVVPSGRLRNMRNARLGVRYSEPRGDSAVTVAVKATGPWQIVERDTGRHEIGPRARARRGGRGQSARRAVAISGLGVFAHVNHPGTRGRHPWEHGVTAAAPQVPDRYQSAVHAELARQFKG